MNTNRVITRLIGIGWSLCMLVGCAGAKQNELLTYAGPQIEGVRQLVLVSAADTTREQIFQQVQGLGESLIWSADGRQVIVYDGSVKAEYLGNAELDQLGLCLSCGMTSVGDPAFSPDGTRVALSGPDGLYVFKIATRKRTRIVEVHGAEMVNWSHDGARLFFSTWYDEYRIWEVNVDGSEMHELGTDFADDGLRFFGAQAAPLDDRILSLATDGSGWSIVVIAAAGTDLIRVTTIETVMGAAFGPPYLVLPTWSPEGERLLYSAAGPDGRLNIYLVGADGSDLVQLTHDAGDNFDPAWSADGTQIAFVSTRDGNREIYIMNADGSEQVNISNTPHLPEHNPSWRSVPD